MDSHFEPCSKGDVDPWAGVHFCLVCQSFKGTETTEMLFTSVRKIKDLAAGSLVRQEQVSTERGAAGWWMEVCHLGWVEAAVLSVLCQVSQWPFAPAGQPGACM